MINKLQDEFNKYSSLADLQEKYNYSRPELPPVAALSKLDRDGAGDEYGTERAD